MSDRLTIGREPSLVLRNEKDAWSPDAKCVVWDFHMFQSSPLAHALVRHATPTMRVIRMIRERIDRLLFP
jgi:hypothetical protein